MPYSMNDKVIAKIPKKDDLELHVKVTTIKNGSKVVAKVVNVREFVPSTETYGKGIVFNPRLAQDVGEALCKIQ